MENFKIGNLENYLRFGVLKIKFKNWNFGKLFENGNFESYLKMGILKIKFENWNFEN